MSLSTCMKPIIRIEFNNEKLFSFSFRLFNIRTMNVTDDDLIMPTQPLALIVQEILFAIVCIVGLLGNTLVIYVVIRFSKMQTVTNMYIVNLAIADECFLIGIPFLIVTMIKGHWIFGEIMCKTYLISTSINQFTSSIFLFIMSADRYIAVCHPISSPKWRTPFISRIVSVCAWTCSIMLMIPIIVHSKEEIKYMNNNTMVVMKTCLIKWSDNNTDLDTETRTKAFATTFTLYNFFFGFAIPLCLILIFYCLVIRKLQTVGPQNKSKEKKRSHKKVTNLVLTVVTVYISCWSPYWITQISLIFSSETDIKSNFLLTIHLLVSCLSYSNSAINPILYAFLSDNFKKSFLKACTCATRREVNATLHLENSVFPRRNKQGSVKFRSTKGTSICANNDEECEAGPLVIKADCSTAATTMTSKSNVMTTDFNKPRESVIKNGIVITLPPTNL